MEYQVMGEISQRKQYVEGIEKWIEKEYVRSEKTREEHFYATSQTALREELVNTLGYPLTAYDKASKKPVGVRQELLCKIEGATLYRMQLEVADGLFFYGMLLLPNGGQEKRSLLFALHGGAGAPEFIFADKAHSGNYSAFGRRAIQADRIIFAPQFLLWDKTHFGTLYNRELLDAKLRQCGGTITGLEVFCLRRALDYFLSLSYVDRDRVGVAGLSYGGMYAQTFAAVDERVRVTLSSCFFGDRRDHVRNDWCYFNQANMLFDAELVTLIAPRKLYIELGDNDSTATAESGRKEEKRLDRLCKKKGIEKFYTVHYFVGKHEFDTADDGVVFLRENL